MPDLLVRDLDPEVYDRMCKAADAQGKSLVQIARDTLTERFKPSKQNAWAEIDRFRESIGPVPGDSTAVIRGMRDRHPRD